jgi:predicted nucleic acid-binding protein
MKALIDTCVILDYLQGREPFFDDALNIAIGAANYEFEAYITANSVTDIYYLIHKHTHSNSESRQILSRLLQLYGILDVTAEDCINALHAKTGDYEDAVMMAAASRNGMDMIVTRNIKDYKESRVHVATPAEFLRRTETNA